jgi:hypothetical protein
MKLILGPLAVVFKQFSDSIEIASYAGPIHIRELRVSLRIL